MCSLQNCGVLVIVLAAVLALLSPYFQNTIPLFVFTDYKNFSMDQIPNMDGKIVLVTGANSGLGFVTADALAAKGATVITACRSFTKAMRAHKQIREKTPDAALDFVELDLGSWRSVNAGLKTLTRNYKQIDVVVANAGVEDAKYQQADGMEFAMRVNHVGHQHLITGIFDILANTPKSRVVVLGSSAHLIGAGMHPSPEKVFDDSWMKMNYSELLIPGLYPYHTYGRSKLANNLFAHELQRRFDARGANVYVNIAHPGGVLTNMAANFAENYRFLGPLPALIMPHILYTPEQGALTQLYLASSPEVVEKNLRSKYFMPHGMESYERAQCLDEDLQKKLWAWTEKQLSRLEKEFLDKVNKRQGVGKDL